MNLWAPQVLQELARHYRVILFDNRGMGKTTASDNEFTIGLFADDAAGLSDALNVGRAHCCWLLINFFAGLWPIAQPLPKTL